MASVRRIGGEQTATRAAIIAATEQVMAEEGYGAASTRRVAARAGLKPSLVHYYFPTTEDMLMAVLRKGAADSDDWFETALAEPEPLMALWRVFVDASRNALALETIAMANHRPSIRAEIAGHSERMRARQSAVIAAVIARYPERFGGCPPEALALVLAGIGRALVMEGGMGITMGHAEARAWVERWIGGLTLEANRAA